MADNPFFRFYRRLKVPMAWRTWERMPRLPSYKNEYWDDHARFTPRPQTCECYLQLTGWGPPPDPPETIYRKHPVDVRRLADEDWSALSETFHCAFAHQQPLSSWGDAAAERASRVIIEWTRLGRDGPLVRDACAVAWSNRQFKAAPLDWACGAAMVTLAPVIRMQGAPEEAAIPHPENPASFVLPHLDWVFVNHWVQRNGIATMLLEHVVSRLRGRGFTVLASTVCLDNPGSLMWHWRNGFTLPPGQWVSRRMKRAAAVTQGDVS